MTRRHLLLVTLAVLILAAGVYGSVRLTARTSPFDTELDERLDGGYFTVLDPEGRILLQTGRILTVGDEFITADNQEYVIYKMEGDHAHARYRRQITLPRSVGPDWPWYRTWLGRVGEQPAQGGGQATVGILHSHSAESYVPSDGTESRPTGGGIIQVGRSFAEALEKQGLRTIHDTTSHAPHDAGAYTRSRRTAVDLMRQNVSAIFDVHRDAAPPGAYKTEIDGEQATQILLVVGRQNPKLGSNRTFAQRLKAAADEVQPGLVKGVLTAQGRYNQDLLDRMVILEVGAHTNRREDAEAGVAKLAEAVPALLGAAGAGRGAQSRSGWVTLAWILGGLVVLLGVYLYLATGSWEELKNKLRGFFGGREFADLFRRSGPRSEE
ncbi:MAG: stage II sporulation protein P [Bacillota bacterium]